MSIDIKPTCCIIGSTTLLIKCANLLMNSDWKIQCIFSSDNAVIQWCKTKQIICISDQKQFKTQLLKTPHDYLFSIVNTKILDKEILAAPQKYAINYHNALLPFYAGMYATFWAIYNNENQHGISWHIMEEGIDTGPILNQQKVDIIPKETSISLNLKCYEAASIGFEKLLKLLVSDEIQSSNQNNNQRTYHSLYQRPENACLLDFNQPSKKVIQQWQAYQFGDQYNNKIGSPKILINDTFYIISNIRETNIKSTESSSTIYNISETSLFVNSKDKVVEIDGLKSLFSKNIQSSTLSLEKGDEINSTLSLTPSLSEDYEKALKSEQFWVRKLQIINYVQFPMVYKPLDRKQSIQEVNFDFSDITNPLQDSNHTNFLQHLSLLILYFARISDQYKFEIPLFQSASNHFNLFNQIRPCTIEIDGKKSIQTSFENVCKQLQSVEKKGPVINDILQRYPILKNNFSSDLLQNFNCSFSIDSEVSNEVKSDWHFNINSNELKGTISFPNHSFNEDITHQFTQHFRTFIQELKPSENLIQSEILTPVESEEIEVKQNQNTIDIPELCIHELFQEQAKLNPNKLALIDSSNQLTYQELDEKSNQLAQTIIQNGISSGNKIGILLQRSNEHIIAMLAILKTGCCYVPLSPLFPEERLSFMIKDCGIKLIINSKNLNEKFNLNNVEYLTLESLQPNSEKHSFPKVSFQSLAYVIYTSGSSGQPKGVPITHLNVVNFLYSIRAILQPKQKRIGALTAPFNFDVSVEEIFSTICFGGTAHIISQDLLLAPKNLASYLNEHKINTIFITPLLLPKLGAEFTKKTIEHLTHILSGVQAKKNLVFKRYKELSPTLKIFNTYGPTEVTFGPTAYEYQGNESDDEETPIGTALPNYSVYVLNQNHKIQPNYVVGELLIGGRSLSPGYLNLPETNQRKFIQLPYGDALPKYTSGDQVYRDHKDNLHFVGRKDNQVKIRGFRIEIGEIETALQQHKSIELAIVRTAKIQESHQQLVAYIKCFPNSSLTVQSIKQFLEKKLPSYCIPSFFIKIDTIPLYPSGKINYNLLPDVKHSIESKTIIKPSNSGESAILKIWQEVLKLNYISIDDSFFEIGGDSLSAVEVISKLHEQDQNEVSLAMFYNFQTIETFAKALNKNSTHNANNPLTLIKDGANEQPIFFVHGLNGSIAVLQYIIDSIQTNQAMYAFQAGNNYEEYKSVQAIAQDYVSHISKLNVKQCTLCGFSFGGILAFEMVRQLNELKIKTNLIQFDSKPIILYKTQKPIYYKLLYVSKVFRWIIFGDNTLKSRIATISTRLQKTKPLSIPQSNGTINIYQKTLIKSRGLANKYKCSKQEIDMVLFKATKEKEGFIGFGLPKNGWTNFTNGTIKIIPIAIHHYDFDKPEHGKIIADLMLPFLN